ncbi:hypothetical protein [Pseudopedobacter beijingensis]|uniref:Lipoprotein n=1 Tax=Pseudopedobacter beijingensis TaxID=1207056 RepID=A0ABW4I836_9SPHI
MKLPLLIISFIYLFLQSCSNDLDHKENSKVTIEEEFNKVQIVDQFSNPLSKDTAFFMTIAEFFPLYIGQKIEQINLVYKPDEISSNRIEEWDLLKRPKQDSIILYIDSSRYVGVPMSIWEYHGTPEYRPSKIGYPVFIKNVSNEALELGFGNMLPLLIEAKDRQGNWNPIQKLFRYDCGTGLTVFYLKPEQIAITSMKVFQGNFRTHLRLVYGYKNDLKIYSNEIVGAINETQFNEDKMGL